MLVKSQPAMRQTVAYLYRRGVDVAFAKSLKELIQIMTGSIKEDYKFSAVYVSVNFPHQRIDTIPGLIEQSFAVPSIVFAEESDRRSMAKISAIQALNVVYGTLSGPAAFLRLQNILKKDEMAASMKRQQRAAAAAAGKPLREEDEDEESLMNSEAGAENEKNADKNRMVYIKSDKVEAKSKSFYHFKKDDPSSVPVADEEAFQELLAEADLTEGPDGDASEAGEQFPADKMDGESTETEGAGSTTDFESDFTDSGSTSDGGDKPGGEEVDSAPTTNSRSSAKDKKRLGRAKFDSPGRVGENRGESESDIFKDPGEGDGPHDRGNDDPSTEAQLEGPESAKEHPPIEEANPVDPVYAASAKPQENPHKEGEAHFFNSAASKGNTDDLHATVEHVSFHHPTTRDERMFDDVIKRCARATLLQLKTSVADMDVSKRAHTEAKLISIKAKKIAGTVFISTGRAGSNGLELVSKAVQIFLEKTVERGLNSNIADILVCGVEDPQHIIGGLEETNFSLCGQSPEFHLMISFIHGLDLFPKMSAPEEGHYSLAVHELGIGEKVTFDVFLKLALNNKFIRYLRPGLSLTPEQAEKLQRYLIETLYVHEKDMQEYKEFKVAQNLKLTRKKAA